MLQNKVKESFRRAADSYDSVALIQRQIADDLVDYITQRQLNTQQVLELGGGTGYLTTKLTKSLTFNSYVTLDCAFEMLLKSRLKNQIPHITAYSEQLPFISSHFDLITTNLMLQWCDLAKAFRESSRTLKSSGHFIGTTFSNHTFSNIASVNHWKNRLPTQKLLENQLRNSEFHNIKVWTKRYYYEAKNLFTFLNELKKIGSCSLQQHNNLSQLIKARRQQTPCTVLYDVIFFNATRE